MLDAHASHIMLKIMPEIVRNFHTNKCDDDCIKNITYDLFFLKNA